MDLYMIFSSLIAGILGAMGFGGGSVLIIYLVNYLNLPQKQAQGINLIFFIPCALLSVITYQKQGLINLRQTLPITIPAIFGALLGFILLNFIPTSILSKLFGIFLVAIGTIQLFNKAR